MPCLRQALASYNVPLERCIIYDIEVACITLEHGESVMMLGRENNVFHSGILGSEHHVFRVELGRIEGACLGTVFADGNFTAVHNPFGSSSALVESVVDSPVEAVRSPVNKHAELGFAPPAHLFIMAHLSLLWLCESAYG